MKSRIPEPEPETLDLAALWAESPAKAPRRAPAAAIGRKPQAAPRNARPAPMTPDDLGRNLDAPLAPLEPHQVTEDSCRALWCAVIETAIFELQPGWGVTRVECNIAHAWFTSRTDWSARQREFVCDLAGIEESALRMAYADGRLSKIARDPVGRKRWATRREREEAEKAAAPGAQLRMF